MVESKFSRTDLTRRRLAVMGDATYYNDVLPLEWRARARARAEGGWRRSSPLGDAARYASFDTYAPGAIDSSDFPCLS